MRRESTEARELLPRSGDGLITTRGSLRISFHVLPPHRARPPAYGSPQRGLRCSYGGAQEGCHYPLEGEAGEEREVKVNDGSTAGRGAVQDPENGARSGVTKEHVAKRQDNVNGKHEE